MKNENLKPHTPHIMFIIGSLDLGGTEQHLTRLVPALKEKSWEVTIVTLSRKGFLAPTVEKNGVSVVNILSPGFQKFIQKCPRALGRFLSLSFRLFGLAKHIKVLKPDFVHFFLPEAYIVGMFAVMLSRFSGVKMMSRRSLNHYQKKRFGIAFLERWLHPKTTMILCNSQAILQDLAQEGVSKTHVRCIYNGVLLSDTQNKFPRHSIRETFGIKPDALVMIIVANLIPYKGHEDLLQALASIQGQLPQDWHVLCVGRDDGIGGKLRFMTQNLNLEKHLHFLGSRTDVAELLSAADIGVLCSHEEGFSNAVIEGMAAGLPMVVTDVGGNKEAVLEGVTGYVVPAKQPWLLGQAILKLALNPSQRSTMGKAAEERARTTFSFSACVDAYHELYSELLNKPLYHETMPCVE